MAYLTQTANQSEAHAQDCTHSMIPEWPSMIPEWPSIKHYVSKADCVLGYGIGMKLYLEVKTPSVILPPLRFWRAIHRALPPPPHVPPSSPLTPELDSSKRRRIEESISALGAIYEVSKHSTASLSKSEGREKGARAGSSGATRLAASLGRRGSLERQEEERSEPSGKPPHALAQGRRLLVLAEEGSGDSLSAVSVNKTLSSSSDLSTQQKPLSTLLPPSLHPLPSRASSHHPSVSPSPPFPPPRSISLPPPHSPSRQQSHSRSKPFVFISTFKWELRKGWDRLVEAYLAEFSSNDNVELYILTKKFMAGR